MDIKYNNYKYIDLAINGVANRNNIINIDSIKVDKNAMDCFTTMFLFKKEYLAHIKRTNSVRGASQFKVWSPYLWFDIDSENLQEATDNMQTLLRGIKSMGVLNKTIVYYSGSKGYHIGINSGVFDFKPSVDLPDKIRFVSTQIASLFNIEIDTKIYNHNRLWRLVDSLHGKTGLRKTLIKNKVAIDSTLKGIQKIVELNTGKRNFKYTNCTVAKPVKALVKLKSIADKGIIKKSGAWEKPPLSNKYSKLIETSLEYLLQTGITKGDRNNETLLRASECRKLNITEDVCLLKLEEWNEFNTPPLSTTDIKRVVESAYTGAGYDFGTNYKSLQISRECARKEIEEIDIEKLLESDTETENENYVRKPLTLTEILDAGSNLEAPELVGEYISWRKRITLLVGREKYSGKSTFCTFEAIAALRKGYRVLWVSPDEPQEDIVYRLVKAGARDFPEQCIIASDMNVPNSWPELGKFIVDAKPDLIILDSVHSLFPFINNGKVPDSSEGAEWQKLMSKLRPLAIVLNTAIVWLHHANKATGLSTGSIGITAAVDAIVTMTPVRKQNRRILNFLGRRVNSTFNCAVDYLDEERGYRKVQDWNVENSNDTKSKSEIVLEWLMIFIASWETDIFNRNDAAQAYRAHFEEDPDQGKVFKNALSKLRVMGIIGMGSRVVGQGLNYNIIDRDACNNQIVKATDLINKKDSDNE